MLANKTIINSEFIPLRASLSAREALQQFQQHNVTVLPVVDSTTQKLSGQLTVHQVKKANPESLVADLDFDEVVKIYRGQHLFEAARLMLQYELRILPVVDREWTFLGVITKQKVLEALSKMLNLAELGSVITVEISPIDWSLSEVVQLIETEGAKILGITVEAPSEEQQNFEVSVKLNIKDVSRVVAALQRYGYNVIAETETEVIGEDLETRADELLKYIDM